MIRIKRSKHPDVLRAQQLHLKKHRLAEGCVFVEGPHPVAEALSAGWPLQTLFLREETGEEDLHTLLGRNASLISPDALRICAPHVMAALANTDHAPPVAAIFGFLSPPDSDAGAFPPQGWAQAQGPLLVLDGVQDPGNLGTLIRCAAAFDVPGVLLTGQGVADPWQPKVIRATAGLVFRLPVHRDPARPLAAWLAALQETAGATIYTTTVANAQNNPLSYHQASWTGPCVLVLGGEGSGLCPSVQARYTALHIPMAAGVDSLNVAVSGGILLSAAYQHRQL
jgi:TrmH family RNA methyltransferase